jgi:hypothetical protein
MIQGLKPTFHRGSLAALTFGLGAGLLVLVGWTSDTSSPRKGSPDYENLAFLPGLDASSGPSVALYSEAEAIAANASLPFALGALETSPPFRGFALPDASLGYSAALDCLTQAIYYEAAGETLTGQRAVAQVVLNRVRHPAFPSSICEVVYQGSERKTGCQFTFTCDGSLTRRPSRHGWDTARAIASAALSGAVEPVVGMATHYHANWVLPYWAPELDKLSSVGAHNFYRWKGNWGRRQAFSQSYTGEVPANLLALASPADLTSSIDDPFTARLSEPFDSDRFGLERLPSVRRESASLLARDDRSIRPRADEGEKTLLADKAGEPLTADLRASGGLEL